MIVNIDTELQLLAQEAADQVVDAMYDDFIDEVMAANEQMMYAAQSYDNDCIYYGEQ